MGAKTNKTGGLDCLLRGLNQLAIHLAAGEMRDLFSSHSHAPYLTRHRIAALLLRIRIVAMLFSGLTLLWILLDAMTLPQMQWQSLALVRVLSVTSFIWLAISAGHEASLTQTRVRLAVLLTIPMLLFVCARFWLDSGALFGLGAINANLYDALPFIVLAGLSIFPLTTVEGVLFALPILGTVIVVQVIGGTVEPVRLVSTLWIDGLALSIYLLACGTQLHYMMALLHRASYDSLTGALTRRSGIEILDLQFRLATEQGSPLAIAFLDLDKFKSLNDEYGHDAGDTALRSAAATLQRQLRKADFVVRWGGEEFVLILPNTDIAGVRIVIQRILAEWLGTRPDGAPLTASIGIAERSADAALDSMELIRLADERMYQAKQNGRARCMLGDQEVLLP